MQQRPLENSGLSVGVLGFGAFKIGRNQNAKYPEQYDLPNEAEVERLLNGLLDLGILYIDTAPAYGVSEERIGQAIAHRREEFVLSTKVGETFDDGQSSYDFSDRAVRDSVARSLGRLKTDVLDVVFVHSNGDDMRILKQTDVVGTLRDLKEQGTIRAAGFSGKTVEGARTALEWADAVMVEYHIDDTSHADVINEAAAAGVGVVVKKGLASGNLPADEAIRFVLGNQNVSSLIVGGLNLEHMRQNLAVANAIAQTKASP